MVRCKFVCWEVAKRKHWKEGFAWNIKLSPVTPKEGEDSIFGEATPSGQVEMLTVREDVADFFVPGKSYYLDFSKVE